MLHHQLCCFSMSCNTWAKNTNKKSSLFEWCVSERKWISDWMLEGEVNLMFKKITYGKI